MKFKIYAVLIISVFIFAGCSRSANSVLNKDPIFAKNMQYTKIGKIVSDKGVAAFVNITYLNATDTNKWDNGSQNFLIGFYDDQSDDVVGSIHLKDSSFIKKVKVDKDDEIYKNIALRSKWLQYFIYTFSDIKGDKVSVTYLHPSGAEVTLSFPKE